MDTEHDRDVGSHEKTACPSETHSIVTGILLGLAQGALAGSYILPDLPRPRQLSPGAMCKCNVSCTGKTLAIHEAEYEGDCPTDWSFFLTDKQPPKILICPNVKGTRSRTTDEEILADPDYILISGLPADTPGRNELVRVFELPLNHKQVKTSVLHWDYSTHRVPAERLTPLLQAVNPTFALGGLGGL